MFNTSEKGRGWKGCRGLVLAGLCLVVPACVPRLEVKPQVLSGRFAGVTADGTPLTLDFSQQQQSILGQGTLGADAVVLAGAAGWRGVATLQAPSGQGELVELALSADGEMLVLEREGQEAVVLERQAAGAPVVAPVGPFSGKFRGVREGAPVVEVRLVQRGTTLVGAGIVTGDAVGITGRALSPTTAEGLVTYLDGTQIRFSLKLRPGGRELVAEGFGEPLTLVREQHP